MICGLVGITPTACFVHGQRAIIIGLVATVVVWIAWYTLPKYVWPFNKVDDALGVVYTHGIAGLLGGLLVGVLADPNVLEYPAAPGGAAFAGAGWLWGHHPHQLLVQFLAALTIIVWDGIITAVIWMFIKYVLRIKLRLTDEQLEIGDVAVHGEEAYPVEESLSTRLSVTAAAEASPSTEEPVRAKEGPAGLALRCGPYACPRHGSRRLHFSSSLANSFSCAPVPADPG